LSLQVNQCNAVNGTAGEDEVAVLLTPVTLPQAPPVELVQSLFDLT
jgi:hypothetical protein